MKRARKKNLHRVVLARGGDWVSFTTRRGAGRSTLANSAGEEGSVSLENARARVRTLLRAGWKVVEP